MVEGELVRLLSASASLLGLGFVMGFSPALYGIALHRLTTADDAARDIRWLSAGIVVGASVLFVAFRAFDPQALTAALQGQVEELLVRRGIDLTAGVVFILLAIVVFILARRRPPEPSRKVHRATADQPHRIFLLGFANTIIGVSGIATMYVTGRVVTGATQELPLRLALYAIFLLTLVGPYLAAAWAWVRFPKIARTITSGYNWLLHRDLRPVFGVGALATGLVFLALGTWGHGGLPG